MARLALQRVLRPEWIDELFEQQRGAQYTRELLFSTTVELMSVVAVGLRPSLHAAAKACKDLPVSVQALYDKIRGTAPALVRALVQGSACRLGELLKHMLEGSPGTVPGYQMRIVDGNHLPASEKRLKPLRGFRGAALPGQSLVVYDQDLDLVVDMLPGEDGHAQERALMDALQEQAQPGQLWIADRNFSTRIILYRWQDKGSRFIVREHSRTPNPLALEPLRAQGKTDSGAVFEQAVAIDDEAGRTLRLRRIELHLAQPTEDGDTVIRLLSNLPASQFTARRVARLYRQRWQIETLFQRLEAVLHSEVHSLGHPRAALLAFGVAVMAYNVLAVLQSAVWVAHELRDSGIELSSYCFAGEVRAHYAGMVMAVMPAAWEQYDKLAAAQLAQELLQIAAYANPKALRKHPRGPKPSPKKGYVSGAIARRHVAT
ncbi:MAG TPA: IS4 family transposase, partial [Noviherbaspirillum sp.]|nr:IS4 family transposase [Noviherbaspirillum sp.]